MSSKLSPVAIIKGHFSTLKSNKTGKVDFLDVAVFYITPAILAIPVAFLWKPDDSLGGILITSLSVFAALLFNLLLLTLDAIRKWKESENSNSRLLLLIKQTYFNIAYAILVALLAVLILLIPPIFGVKFGSNLHAVIWTFVYALSLNFALTIFMILKRMHVILTTMMPNADGKDDDQNR